MVLKQNLKRGDLDSGYLKSQGFSGKEISQIRSTAARQVFRGRR